MIFLCHASDRPLRVRSRVAPDGEPAECEVVPWLFLGRDSRVANAWNDGLGPGFQRIPIGRLLDVAADELRTPFLVWMDELNRQYGAHRSWWFTQLSERNTLVSPLFLFVCYLAAV